MIKLTKLWVGFLFLSGSGYLQSQSLLWEISGNGLKEKSYLFGSIHIQDKRVFNQDSLVWNRFEAAPYFAMEFDVEKVNQMEMANRMMMQKTYEELLSEEDYQLFEKAVTAYAGIPMTAAQRIKPFFISTLISQSFLPKDEKDPMDLFFLKKARAAGKKVLELESFAEQMNVIDSVPFDEQLESLRKLIRQPDIKTYLQKELESLIEAYLSQNDKKLYKLMVESEDSSEVFMKKFIHDRNHKMVKRIRIFAANGSTFIVVGSGHLSGEEGLVKLLKNAGYTLTPICDCL